MTPPKNPCKACDVQASIRESENDVSVVRIRGSVCAACLARIRYLELCHEDWTIIAEPSDYKISESHQPDGSTANLTFAFDGG